LGEASVRQAEEMVGEPLGEEEGGELWLPERVAGEVRAQEGGGVDRRYVALTTTKGSV
jgi:hypothetical protein